MARESQTTARLQARLPANIHALVNRTAEIEGRTKRRLAREATASPSPGEIVSCVDVRVSYNRTNKRLTKTKSIERLSIAVGKDTRRI